VHVSVTEHQVLTISLACHYSILQSVWLEDKGTAGSCLLYDYINKLTGARVGYDLNGTWHLQNGVFCFSLGVNEPSTFTNTFNSLRIKK
jgi:hypothetical protein